MKPLNFYEHINGMSTLRNQVNVGRASIPYINLEAADPSSKRPACLFVISALTPCQVSLKKAKSILTINYNVLTSTDCRIFRSFRIRGCEAFGQR